MDSPVNRFVRSLTARHRVIALGGLAVIAHGNPRKTIDADIWLEPMDTAADWARTLEAACSEFGDLEIKRLPGWIPVSGQSLVEAVDETGMVRLSGLDCPLDVFRKPNEVEMDAFESFHARGRLRDDGTVLPHPLDLIETKLDTGRERDLADIRFLETLVKSEYFDRLPTATLAEATEMLDRFADWQVLRVALAHSDPAVRDLARRHLQEFADAGDPFSQAILEGRPIPGE
jgi:hypothetical protein